MKLNDVIEKLKTIEPDAEYSRKSKFVILSREQGRSFPFSFKNVALGVLRSGWSMAFVVVILFLAVGSFSVLKIFVSPATTAVVDIAGLKAEAQAIDAQIQLTNLSYSYFENETSTVSAVQSGKSSVENKKTSVSSANASTTDEIINAALEELSR